MTVPDTLKYSIGDVVYLRVDDESRAGMITGVLMRLHGYVYYVTWGDRSETIHMEVELTAEKTFTSTTNG